MVDLVGNLSFDLDEHTLNDQLIRIAELALCKGSHQDQAPELVERWMKAIRRAKRREEKERKRREEEQERNEAEVPEGEADEEEDHQEQLERVRRQPLPGEPIPRQEIYQQDTDLADIRQEESAREDRCSEEDPQQEKHPKRKSPEERPSQETMHDKETEAAEEWYRDGNHEANQEEGVGVDVLPQDSDSCEANSEEPQSQHAKRHVLDIPPIPSPPNQGRSTPQLWHRRNSEPVLPLRDRTSDQPNLCPDQPQMNSDLSRSKSVSSASIPTPTAVAEDIPAESEKNTQLEEHVDSNEPINLEESMDSDPDELTNEVEIMASAQSPQNNTTLTFSELATRSAPLPPETQHSLSRKNTDDSLYFNTAPSSPVVEPLTPSSGDTSMQNTPSSTLESVPTVQIACPATRSFSIGYLNSDADVSYLCTPAPVMQPLPIRTHDRSNPADRSDSEDTREACQTIALACQSDILEMLDRAGVRLGEHCKEMVRDAVESEVPALELDLETGWDIMDAVDRFWI